MRRYSEPAFYNAIEAWQFGPVIPCVYYKYCGFGAMPITIVDNPKDIQFPNKHKNIIDDVVEEKRAANLWDLASEVERKGSPWERTYKDGKGKEDVIPLQLLYQGQVVEDDSPKEANNMLGKNVVSTVMKMFVKLDAKKQVKWVERENGVHRIDGYIHPMDEFNSFICDLYRNVKGNSILQVYSDCMCTGTFDKDDYWFCFDEDNNEFDSARLPCDLVRNQENLVTIILQEKDGLEEIGFSHEEAEKLRKKVVEHQMTSKKE